MSKLLSSFQREHENLQIDDSNNNNTTTTNQNNNNKNNNNNHPNMGQAVRTMRYDRAANEANAVAVLEFAKHPLKWHRLDDGVMGGKSESLHQHEVDDDQGILHFTGTINTEGGGFCSVRAPIEGLPAETTAIRLVVRGDGKTYKFIMTNRERGGGGPFASFPSFQADVPTRNIDNDKDWQDVTLPLESFLPNFGGRMTSRPPHEDVKNYKLHASDMTELGIMLSLKLSDGAPNPKETFGEGIFPFSLHVKSVEPVVGTVAAAVSNEKK